MWRWMSLTRYDCSYPPLFWTQSHLIGIQTYYLADVRVVLTQVPICLMDFEEHPRGYVPRVGCVIGLNEQPSLVLLVIMGIWMHISRSNCSFQDAHEVDFYSFFVHVDNSATEILSFFELYAQYVEVHFNQYVRWLSEYDISLIREVAYGDTQT